MNPVRSLLALLVGMGWTRIALVALTGPAMVAGAAVRTSAAQHL